MNLRLLNTNAFTKRISATVGGEISVMDARSVPKPILRVFQLRKVMVSEVQLPGNRIIQLAPICHHLPSISHEGFD